MTLNQNNFSIEKPKPKPVEKAPAASKKKAKKQEPVEAVEHAQEEEK